MFGARDLGGERYASDVRLGLEPPNDFVAQLRGSLRVRRVLLTWTGGAPDFCAYRSLDPERIAGRGSIVASTAGRGASDAPPAAAGVVFYQVTGR